MESHARPYFPETLEDIDTRIANGERVTVGMAMELLDIPSVGVDTAIPQAWADMAWARTGIRVNGQVVWSYRPEHGAPNLGCPVPLTREGERAIQAMRPNLS